MFNTNSLTALANSLLSNTYATALLRGPAMPPVERHTSSVLCTQTSRRMPVHEFVNCIATAHMLICWLRPAACAIVDPVNLPCASLRVFVRQPHQHRHVRMSHMHHIWNYVLA